MRAIERSVAIALAGIRAAVSASPIPAERQIAVTYYLAVTGINADGGVIGRVVGCTRQNVNKALKKIEDLRDDPAFDAALTALETTLFGEV